MFHYYFVDVLYKQISAEVELERNLANWLQVYLWFYYNLNWLIVSLSVFISFVFALKVRLKGLKFEFCQFKLE